MQATDKDEQAALVSKSIDKNIDTYYALRRSINDEEAEKRVKEFISRFKVFEYNPQEVIEGINREKQNRLQQIVKSLHRVYQKGYASDRQKLKIKAIFRMEGRRSELDKQ